MPQGHSGPGIHDLRTDGTGTWRRKNGPTSSGLGNVSVGGGKGLTLLIKLFLSFCLAFALSSPA